jgi:hypothetical protein
MQIYQRLPAQWSRQGLCAPLIGPATVTATKTANAHPAVITIHPELLPFVFFQNDVCDYPLPSKKGVPIISATNGVIFCFRDKIILQPSFQRAQRLCSSFQ